MSSVAVSAPQNTTSKPAEDSVSPTTLLVYHCWICTAEFLDKLGIVRHLKAWHKDVPELKGIEKKMKNPICLECGAPDPCEHHRQDGDGADGGREQTPDVDHDDVDDDGDEDNDSSGVVHPRYINCITCGLAYTNAEALHKHRESAHPDDQRYQCTFCPSTFAEQRYLVVHTRIHTGHRPYICQVCGNRFPKSGDLKRHARIHSGEKPFKCAQCNQTFTQKGSLEKHARIHAKRSGGHACLMCGLVFMQLAELTEHTQSAHSEVNYSCKTCGKMYMDEKYLILHEKSHDTIKPYTCTHCGKSFTFRALLVKHENKVHLMKREIKCDECGKLFQRRENLNRHKLSHTGVKNHKCSVCGMAFTEKGSLTRHFRSQHDQLRPHTCHICGKAFTRRNLLRRHMDRYHDKKGEKEVKERVAYFRCKLCKKSLRKSGLRQHMRHHRHKGDEWEGSIEDVEGEELEVEVNEEEEDEEEYEREDENIEDDVKEESDEKEQEERKKDSGMDTLETISPEDGNG